MARGHGGRIAAFEDVFEYDETAQIAQQEEYRLAPWLENRFELLMQKIVVLTATNQLRNQPPIPLPNPQPVEEEIDGDFKNSLAELEARGWSSVNNLDSRRRESRLLIDYNSFVDWNSPPIYDVYPEDFHVDNESIGGNTFEFEREDCDNYFFEFFENKLSIVVDLASPPKYDEDIIEPKGSEVEHYDFTGIDQILSMSCVKTIICTYLRMHMMKTQLLYAIWNDVRKAEGFEYSKYLFTWGGRHQYLCNEDPSNSRPNSLQHGENDAARNFQICFYLFIFQILLL